MLAFFVQDGVLSPDDLAQLAPRASADLVQAISAIAPLRVAVPEVFKQSLKCIVHPEEAPSLRDSSAPPPPQSLVGNEKLFQDVSEIVVIAIDVSGSMQTPFECDNDPRTVDRTRLEAVKQCFMGFRDATERYQESQQGRQHLLGLVSFSNSVTVHTQPTPNLNTFEDVIDDMHTNGRTAIFDAVAKACELLEPMGNRHPNADLRVLVLSDGLNNASTVSADRCLKRLAQVGATCDAIILGSNADKDLRKLVAASEGTCVEMTSLADAFDALESDGLVSLSARRTSGSGGGGDGGGGGSGSRGAAAETASSAAMRRAHLQHNLHSVSSLKFVTAAPAQKGAVVVPVASSTQHNVATGDFVPLEAFLQKAMKAAPTTSSALPASNKRVMSELRDLNSKQPLLIGGSSLFFYVVGVPPTPSAPFVQHMKVLLVSRPSPPFQGRVLELLLEFPATYPFVAPRLQIVTPVYHYAVSSDGKVCLPILGSEWSPAKNMKHVLTDLEELLHDPTSRIDPHAELSRRSWLSDLLRTDPEAYARQASTHAAANAPKLPTPPPPSTSVSALGLMPLLQRK
jgi:ubiquitin-protein ligase/Mg-chelatase subunit ChlD